MRKSTIELGNDKRCPVCPVNFAFTVQQYVTSFMHHTGKNRAKKKFLKKKISNAPRSELMDELN